MEKAVEIRNKMKKKKPVFIKQMGRQITRLKKKWRKPRGSDSKIKVGKKDYPKKIKKGYKGPKEARGLSREGFGIVVVYTLSQLSNIDKTKEIVCIGKIGQRKKIDIVKKCSELGLKVLNVKNPSEFLKDVEDKISKNKEEKAKKAEEKKKSAEKKEEKSKEGKKESKENIESKVDNQESEEEEKKEKKEKDKILTKREI